jgi:CheY-like chemotaxis protein
MFEKEWPILLVDDDPDVLKVSTLAMKNFQIDGQPVRLYTAKSKAEAVDLLGTTLGGRFLAYVAVAFIDVVMETDTAGLELCEFIRETQQNRLTQIYIRTGQPGVAPERAVIDRYDINGYFTKVELTEDKLYSLVKAGVRQFDFSNIALGAFQVVAQAIAQADSLENLAKTLNGALEQMPLDAQGNPTHEYHRQVSVIIGDRVLTTSGYTEAEAFAERDRLERLGLRPLDASGDGYIIDGHSFLVKVAATDTNDVAWHLMHVVGAPGLPGVLVTRVFTRAVATLAKRVARASREAVVSG